jgi:hypothetical protein
MAEDTAARELLRWDEKWGNVQNQMVGSRC